MLRITPLLWCVVVVVAVLAPAHAQQDSSAPVEAGRAALVSLAKNNTAIVQQLEEALMSGDLEAAKAAYAKSRWAYEQIEVWAGGFGDIDCDIDCRPYAYDYGEALGNAFLMSYLEPGTHFKGFHKIEGLLYRDGNVSSASDFIDGLKNSSSQLTAALDDASNFDGKQALGNAAGLAREVASKKISSEEETFSDLSNLIFVNNFKGIRAVVEPFLDGASDGASSAVKQALDDADAAVDGMCSDYTDGATCEPYSQTSMEARAKIVAASNALANAVNSLAADLNLVESGEEEDAEDDCVANSPPTAYDGTSEQIQAGLKYFKSLMPQQMATAKDLKAKIASGDLEATKAAYDKSRPFYEQIEVLAASFEDTDCAIDCRPYSFDEGEESEEFKGFHVLEYMIFRDGLANQSAATAAVDELISTLEKLETELNDASLFNAEVNFDGMIGLAGEVVSKKISSEEETYSDQSVLIFDNNWKGILSQAKPFFELAPEAGALVQEAYDAAMACIADYVMDDGASYAKYSTVDMKGRECITEEGYRLKDAVVGLANALNIYTECHPFHESRVYNYRHEGVAPS